MKQITIFVIVGLIVCVTFGTATIFVYEIKNQEITNLKTKYDTEISNLNTSISNYAKDIDNLTANISSLNLSIDRYKFIGTWQDVNNSTSKISFYPSGKFSGQFYNYSNRDSSLVASDWRIENGKLVIDRSYELNSIFYLYIYPYYHSIEYHNYSFSENNNTLFLTLTEIPNALMPNGFTSVLIKQF